VDLASFCGHKIYAPKGVGALYVRDGVTLRSTQDGGGQERGLRSGTLAVPGIVGFGRACELAREEIAREGARLSALRERLKDGIFAGLDGVYLNGHATRRVPGSLNLSFAGVDGEELMTALSEIAVSSGAACNSAGTEPSYVLRALGIGDERAQGALRFGIGRFNSREEVEYVIERVCAAVRQLRDLRGTGILAGSSEGQHL